MELYKGMPGSPITYLASDISAGQTTISVADDTALPDAPNICTIGYGEELETIKYGTKSNGVLQNVTRGIEGAPRAWQAGTEVARFFTAYDHDAIAEALSKNMADYASMPEIITGSDGTAIKFPSGLMICTGRKNYSYDELVVDGVVSFEIAFPQPFIENPRSITDSLRVLDSMRARGYTGNISGLSSTGLTYDIALGDVLRSGGYIEYTAIGFWK